MGWRLSQDDADQIATLVGEVVARFDSVENREFLRATTTLAQELPVGLRAYMNEFRLLEPSGVCLISGLSVDDRAIGPTPAHWRERVVPSPTLREEVYFALCASLLGDLVGWATQQDGRLFHDVIPIRGDETKQLSSASEALITWHVEDAFHPFRADYLGLLCLRNHEAVETTFVAMDDIQLDEETTRVLFEPRFFIRPDESHLEGHRQDADAAVWRRYQEIKDMRSRPERISVLFGSPAIPYIRIDPYFMDPPVDDPEADAALRRLSEAIDKELRSFVLRPGDVLLIDNYRVVHGRYPFTARYDGTDRWLKRLNVTRDLRKSRGSRLDTESRIIL